MPDPAGPAGQGLARGAERATWVVTAVVLFAVGLRVVAVPPGDPTTPQRLMGLLIALAACAVAALTIRRAPSIAWIAAVSAAGLGAVEVVALREHGSRLPGSARGRGLSRSPKRHSWSGVRSPWPFWLVRGWAWRAGSAPRSSGAPMSRL